MITNCFKILIMILLFAICFVLMMKNKRSLKGGGNGDLDKALESVKNVEERSKMIKKACIENTDKLITVEDELKKEKAEHSRLKDQVDLLNKQVSDSNLTTKELEESQKIIDERNKELAESQKIIDERNKELEKLRKEQLSLENSKQELNTLKQETSSFAKDINRIANSICIDSDSEKILENANMNSSYKKLLKRQNLLDVYESPESVTINKPKSQKKTPAVKHTPVILDQNVRSRPLSPLSPLRTGLYEHNPTKLTTHKLSSSP